MVTKTKTSLVSICLTLFSSLALSAPQLSQSCSGKAICTFQVIYGGKLFNNADIEKLAKNSVVVTDRHQYRAFPKIKSLNPDEIILIYQNGPQVAEDTDHLPPQFLNNIGRFDISRGNTKGSVNDHPEWFLRNESGGFVRNSINKKSRVLDYGNPEVRDFWIESTQEDLVSKPWKGDGIWVDNFESFNSSAISKDPSRLPAKYPDPKTNDTVTNTFIADITKAMHEQGQLIVPNRTNSRLADGEFAWLDLDSRANPPDMVFEEGAFSVRWGLGDVQFFSPEDWSRQITIPSKLQNSSVAFLSHTDLSPGQTGVDSKGNAVNFNQIFFYSLGSYLLAKNEENPTLFSFDYSSAANDRIIWYDAYDEIDLGGAIGEATPVSTDNNQVYMREFENGYVYVNPASTKAGNIPAPSDDALEVAYDLDGNLLSMNELSNQTLSIGANSAAFVLKSQQVLETDPVPTEETDPVPTEETDPVPTEETDPVPTEETDPVPTEETDPVPTEETDPVPTEETDPVPTEREYSPIPTDENGVLLD